MTTTTANPLPLPLALAFARTLIANDGARIRKRHRLAMTEVAAGLGVSAVTVASWETGAARPRKAHAIAYVELLIDLIGLELEESEK